HGVRSRAPHPDPRGRVLRDRSAVHDAGDDGVNNIDWSAVRAVVMKDITAVRRSRAVLLPMLLVPLLLLVGIPLFVGLMARSQDSIDVHRFLDSVPGHLAQPILDLPQREQ